MELKSLAKDTAIYGLSSIVGRFLNYLLVPLYTNVIPASTGGYGIVSNVYAFTALMLVFLTFGMETGFFRFANRQDEDPRRVYANALLFVGGLSLLFVIVCLAGLGPLSDALEYADHPEFVGMMVVVVALDSFQCIPFAYLRYKKRPIKFAAIKLFSIVGNIALNLFFLVLCPRLMRTAPGTVDWFYDPDYVVGYIFLSNLICSAVQMFFFIPELRGFSYRVDRALMRRMVSYSFPLLILGLVGVLNMTEDLMIYPFLYDDRQEGMKQLGIYSATSKVAMVMAMFTQAFRYAYEPFVFGKSNDSDSRETYAKAMKYFFIFALLAFLAVMGYMDILRYLVARDYWEGLSVVAIVMGAEILKGIYLNLSFWYKREERTQLAVWVTFTGLFFTVVMTVALVPALGYVGAAWARRAREAAMVGGSYWRNRRYYPTPYDLRRIGEYVALGLGVFFASAVFARWLPVRGAEYAVNGVLFGLFGLFAVRREHIDVGRLLRSVVIR